MAEQAGVQTQAEGPARSPGRRKNLMFAGIFLGVMIAEGVGVGLMVKFFSGGPATAEANQVPGLNANEGVKQPEDVEVQIATFRAQNARARQVIMYDVSVVVAVGSDKEAELKAQIERKKAAIQDRFISTIRAADPQVLAEPDCETLRQQFHQILVEILGSEELAKKVYIPQFTTYRAD
jgi:flagellar basal body-associated protein FliL